MRILRASRIVFLASDSNTVAEVGERLWREEGSSKRRGECERVCGEPMIDVAPNVAFTCRVMKGRRGGSV